MKRFSSLSRSIQGNNLLENCAVDILKIGHRPLVLCVEWEYNKDIQGLVKHLTCHGLITKVACLTEMSQALIEEVGEMGFQHRADLVIGFGTNIAMECAKAVANLLGLPFVLIPTSLSLPSTSLPFVVAEEWKNPRILLEESVRLIIVDRDLLLAQPVSDLKAGIINSLLYLAVIKKINNHHLSSLVDGILIKGCESALLKDASQAIVDFENSTLSRALKDILEVLTVLNGYCLSTDAWSLVEKLGANLAKIELNWLDESLRRNAFILLLFTYLNHESEEKMIAIIQWCKQLHLLPFSNKIDRLELLNVIRKDLKPLGIKDEEVQCAIEQVLAMN
ncbi:iron-containing alcohol dehydrogenase [Streptococcus ruminantium]|uniref:iron-containing alcohol dehydrogenase n=1 Tax=Streptococcus ruminantium TaxID=1917441 RepID=UPI001F3662EC|nr:iron-containing alcohol dehydrogenase [Streptococcus ruminantium]BDD40681.1 glycerol dehydrogenase [Streptococcus ruminantium]